MVSTARTGAGVKRSAGACLRNLRVRGDLLQRILDCFKTSKWILSIIFVTGQHLQPYMTECLYCQINWYLDHNVRKYTYDYGFTWTIAFLFHQVLLALWVHDRWLCLLNKLGSAYPCCSNGGLNGLGRCGVYIYIYACVCFVTCRTKRDSIGVDYKYTVEHSTGWMSKKW